MRTRLDDPYPMLRAVHAPLPQTWEGPVHVWDIDKTYLDTRFSQLKSLARIPFELGVDKKPVPGAVPLLHALREGADGRSHVPLHFVSASPHQISRAIERRMLLDGVEWDSVSYKDPVRLLFRGETHQLKEQIAFKLGAMLLLAKDAGPGARFHLFGDDVEGDPLVSCLFADVLAGRLRNEALVSALLDAGCHEVYARRLAVLANDVAPREGVAGAWIRLQRDKTGAWLERFPPHVRGYASVAAVADEFEAAGLVSRRHATRLRQAGDESPLLYGQAPASEAWTPKN